MEENVVKENLMTYEGLKALEAELDDLKVNKRRDVSQKIKEAREQGDLSENAEYDAAKDEQRDIEARIEEITKILKTAKVVDDDEIAAEKGKVNIGKKVTVLDIDMDENVEYKIVGSTEANILLNLISNESPLGKALIGHKKNDVVEVPTPSGDMLQYKILKVEKA